MIPSGYAKLKVSQKEFQIDNGLKIHQRGGAVDKVLYFQFHKCIK